MQLRTHKTRSTQALSAAFFLLIALTGCSGAPGNDAAAGAIAGKFAADVSTGDASSACDLIADDTKSTLEAETKMPCTTALTTLGLPGGGDVVKTQAYARAAESVLDTDVIFLTLQSDGWKITAAGCTARTDMPYHCILKGD